MSSPVASSEMKSPKKWASMQTINVNSDSNKELCASKNIFDAAEKTNESSATKQNKPEIRPANNNSNNKRFSSTERLNKPISSFISSNKLKSVEDIRVNMNQVLDEIKKRERERSKSQIITDSQYQKVFGGLETNQPQPQRKQQEEVVQQASKQNDDIYFHSDLETARIVKKLKQKFDNKDQTFIKVS